MAKNAEVSKQEENEEEEMGEKQEKDGAGWFLIINVTIVDIFLLNWISVVTMLVNWCCSYAHPSIIDLTNSETHAKCFKNAQFSWKNVAHADLDSCVLRRDAKRDAPRPTKTPKCGVRTIFTNLKVTIFPSNANMAIFIQLS